MRGWTTEERFVAFYRREYPGAVRLALALTQWRDGRSEDFSPSSWLVADWFTKS